MTKDLMFKLRLDARDRERLDALVEHYSAPAATVLRILIKREFDALPAALATVPHRAGSASVRNARGPRPKPSGEAFVALAEKVVRSPAAEPTRGKAPRVRKH